ncbi:type IV pilus biogenesis/stability protein PilW [Legionella impletisoli]|uniref:Type IV pilus biogenesis/stability protein PilW n=1 Tax=Legionella impletisoli TaxID=343510 RepID=A0A917JP88_9GAMM|nr:type IV pilus biogenesis/stability protein PilW [Legionella impletisoli]GGI76193.1 type IV pilus biogenesis/stability protein PilW [Legionella impletisoli]
MKTYLLFIITAFLLVACQQNKDPADEPISKEYNRADAASFNTQLGLAYLKQGNPPRAKRKLLLALSQAPDSPGVNAAMAYFLEKTGDINEARTYYKKAMSLAPGSGAQLNNYGTFLCRQGEYKHAEEYFAKAVKDVKYENTAAAYENAGLCALEIPDYPKAKHYFSRALEQDPSRKQSLYELVNLEMKQDQYQEVLANLQKYPKIALNDTTLLKIAAEAANNIGQSELELNYKQRLLQLNTFSDNSGAKNEYNNH